MAFARLGCPHRFGARHAAGQPQQRIASRGLQDKLPRMSTLGVEPAPRRLRHPDAAKALEVLWSLARGDPLWAVLDGAQDERISTWVRGGSSLWGCLYAGELAKELEEVAPYFVRFLPGRAEPVRLLENGWERAWGVFAVTTAPQAELRRHLRRHLRVRTEEGKTLLLRWYDPRVLRIYLPTCNTRELKQFFGPVRAFIGEGPGNGTLQMFTEVSGRLEVETIAVAEPR